MKIKIICVGKIRENFYKDAVCEYSKRLSRFTKIEITELSDEKIPDNASDKENELVLKKEGELILNAIRNDEYVISLCVEGKKYSSPGLAKELSDIFSSGNSCIDLIIGGSLGLSNEVKNRSDLKLSFSDMTFPHQLMRVILLEQIYRAFKINNNEKYHK